MNHLSLMGKVNRDQQFGNNSDFRSIYNNERCDSALSSSSADSGPEKTDKVIVDLDLIAEKWIAHMWEKTKSKSNKFELDDLQIIVNWNKVEFEQDDAKFDTNTNKSKSPTTQTLFRTYFTNKTDQEQEYSFKTERITRQSCCFSFIKGYSREKEGGITFKLPQDVLEIGGGIRSEQSVECGKEQTNEQEISWSVDSMIKVKPQSRTSASLVISEMNIERSFVLETRIKGRLIAILNNRENNQFVKSFSGDITEIVRKAIESYWIPASNSHIFEIIADNSERYVRSIVKGKCKFRLGVEQHVTLNEEKI